MAAKKDNTLLWVAGLGIAGYLYYQYKNGTLQIPGVTPAPATTTAPAPAPTLLLNPAPAINTNTPATPVSSAPHSNAINVTDLVPAMVTNGGQLQPGQNIAVAPNGSPITNGNGVPMVFASVGPTFIKPQYLASIMGGCEDEVH